MKTEVLHIRLTKEEKEKLKNLSEKQGLKISQFILQCTVYKDCHDNFYSKGDVDVKE